LGEIVTVGYEPLEGGAALQDLLSGMADRASNWVPAFDAIVDSFYAIERRRFADNGPGWAPLADSTISMTGSWARQNTNYDQILVDTGVMQASLTSGGAEGADSEWTPFSVAMMTTIPYAHWHQTGGFRLHASGAGWPPQRRIVDMAADGAALEWAAILEGWLLEGAEAAELVGV
jgi:hypothetical protein